MSSPSSTSSSLAARARSLAALLCLVLAGCGGAAAPSESDGGQAGDGGSSPDAGADAGTQEAWVRSLVEAHNRIRAGAEPTPQPALAPLTWSDTLAARAQAWAERCQYAHSRTPGLGENLLAAAGTFLSAEQVVDGWAGEAPSYDYATNSCASGEACGHYTQLVWRDTQRVGCGQAVCTQGSPFGAQFPEWQFVVCNYDPPGNVVGQRPY